MNTQPPSPRDSSQCAVPSTAPSRAQAIQKGIKARAPPQSQAAGIMERRYNNTVERTPTGGGPTPSSLTSTRYSDTSSNNYELATPYYKNSAHPRSSTTKKDDNNITTRSNYLQNSMTSEFSARKSNPPTATSHPTVHMSNSNYQQQNLAGGKRLGQQQGMFSRINDENNPNDRLNIEQQQQQQPMDSFTLDSINSSDASSLSIHDGESALQHANKRWGNIDVDVLLKDQGVDNNNHQVDNQHHQQISRAESPLSAGRFAIGDDHSSITTSSLSLSPRHHGNGNHSSQIDQLQNLPLDTTTAVPSIRYSQEHTISHVTTNVVPGNNDPPPPTTTSETDAIHSRLHSLEIQHENLLSTNKALANQLRSDRERIVLLESSEEEARQEAALWEARWRDDFGQHTGSGNEASASLLEQLRGALLQKSKEEYDMLKHQLVALSRKFEKAAESYELLMAENKALREEVRQGGAVDGINSNAHWERRALDSEKELMKRKGELHQLTKTKQTLEERLNQLLESSETSRKDFEAIKDKLEQQHQAKIKQIASEAAQMIEVQTSSTASELVATTQENALLKEENKAQTEENEKLAEKVVDLERKINASLKDVSDLRKSLLDAETAIPKLETERNELREKITKLKHESSSSVGQVGALKKENERLKLLVPSLEEQVKNVQNGNKALRRENDDVKSKLSIIEEENIQVKSENLAMKERLDKEVEMAKALEQTDRNISKENSVLRSSISGFEHKLVTVEASLLEEREKVVAAEKARDLAVEKAEQFESQVKSLEYDISTANQFNEKKREEHLELQDNINELKRNILSLREEISAAAIAQSQLELELKQRKDECSSLRKQLDPMEKEKYRLELDNASLIEELESLKKSIDLNYMPNLENEGPDSIVKKLEERNRLLSDNIASLQKDLATSQLSQHEAESPMQSESSVVDDVRTDFDAMLQRLNDARAAAKKAASFLKDQRVEGTIDVTDTPTVVPDDNDANQFAHSSTNTPRQLSPDQYSSQSKNSVVSPEQARSDNPYESEALQPEMNVLKELEEKHSTEKSVLKSKFRGRLRRMKKEWELERKTILGLVATHSYSEVGADGRVTKSTPANYVEQLNADGMIPSAASCDAQSIASSYDETEAFIMNILNDIAV
jgi:hypothetical protein